MQCQDIANDISKWRKVTNEFRSEWMLCLKNLQVLEENLEIAKRQRLKMSYWIKMGGYVFSGCQNIVAGIAAILPFLKFDTPPFITSTVSIFSLVMSLALWSNLSKRSHEYLVISKDLEKIQITCKSVRRLLRDVMDDGVITSHERAAIRDMMGMIYTASENISNLDLIIRILGESPADQQCKDAIKNVSEIIDSISRGSSVIGQKFPEIIKEYKDSKIQLQIVSISPDQA